VHNGETHETEKLIYSYSLSKSTSISGRIENNCNSKGCVGYKSMATLEERLKIWIEAHCLEKNPRPQRVFELNAILLEIYNDRRFWKYRNQVNRSYYEDALSNMWDYFFRNLCETNSARVEHSFLETCNYAVGRLLTSLNGHLINIQLGISDENGKRVQPSIGEDGIVIDPFAMLPNPEPRLTVRQFEEFLHFLKRDPTGELVAKENTLRGRNGAYTLTAQQYLLMRYRDDMTIQQIADELKIPRGTLLDGRWQKKWKELARKFAQMAIDSVSD
jgi:hypothetical protein